jgi:hypothetical protein
MAAAPKLLEALEGLLPHATNYEAEIKAVRAIKQAKGGK